MRSCLYCQCREATVPSGQRKDFDKWQPVSLETELKFRGWRGHISVTEASQRGKAAKQRASPRFWRNVYSCSSIDRTDTQT